MDLTPNTEMLQGFLLGVIAMSSATAGAIFFKFWRRTHDSLFLVFGIAFLVEGLNRTSILFLDRPSEGNPAVYVIRLLVFLLILAAIVRKNYGTA